MVDVNEKLGRAACTELQNEYSRENVMFTLCDVTKREQLVRESLVCCHAAEVWRSVWCVGISV